jgi:hypothetical protein
MSRHKLRANYKKLVKCKLKLPVYPLTAPQRNIRIRADTILPVLYGGLSSNLYFIAIISVAV